MNSPAAVSLFAALILGSGSAFANQPAEPSESSESSESSEPATESENLPVAETQTGFTFEARVHGSYLSDADFDDGTGEFGFAEYGLGIKASRRVGDMGMLSIDFNAGIVDYDITPSATAVAGDAASIGSEFDTVTTLSLIGMYAARTDEGLSWFVGGGVLSNGENSADFGDTIDGMLMGGFRYKVNNKLELGIGVAARTRLDDDVLVVPMPQVRYTINEYWSIESEGVGLKFNYKASDALDYGLTAQFASTTFRLDDSHAAAPEGIATHRRFPIAFYTIYEPNDTIEISGRIGAMMAGELEILDTNGNDLTSQDIDTGIFGSINVSFKF